MPKYNECSIYEQACRDKVCSHSNLPEWDGEGMSIIPQRTVISPWVSGNYALFVLIQTPTQKTWVYAGQETTESAIALFVRNVESDIELTKDMPVKTLMYKIVNLDG